jgi:predicted DNA-binding antitoxin AbrB/MazE fold protein
MNQIVPAIFDAGVFRPLKPVELADGTRVELQLEVPAVRTPSEPEHEGDETKKAWQAYIQRMEALPDNSPRDGFSNRDHDRVIYGG